MSDSAITIKGIFLKFDIDRAKKVLSHEVLLKLGIMYGKSLRFSAVADYPIEDEVELLTILGELMYPSVSSEERWKKLGEDDSQTFMNSQIGKIGLQLMMPDLETGVKNISRLFELFHHGMICKTRITEEEVCIDIPNNPYPPLYYKGFFEKVLEGIGQPHEVRVETGPGKCVYMVKRK